MKPILRIAKTELSILFYSPVAWLVLTIFTFQCALLYIGNVQGVVSAMKLNVPLFNLTRVIYSIEGFFGAIRLNLYLYIPLLTMGLMSREISSGSIKLLQSSPLNTTQVILGKYLGIIAFGLIMLTMIIFFLIGGGFIIVNADTGLMISGVIGIYLLICTFCAIGLLMSCLTSYQVVAAITTFTAVAALTFIGSLWQHIPFFNNLASILSMQDRSADFLEGLVSSDDVFYYLLVIFLSLGTAILYLQHRQFGVARKKTAFRFASLLVVVVFFAYLSSRPYFLFYYDLTATQLKTVSENTQSLLKRVDGPLKITTYVNMLDGSASLGFPAQRNKTLKFFEPYQRFLKDEIEMKSVYYYDSTENIVEVRGYDFNKGLTDGQMAKREAENNSIDFNEVLSPEEVRRQLDVGAENYRLVYVLESGNKKSYLRMFKDIFTIPFEEEVVGSLKTLIDGPLKVVVAADNQQRSVTREGQENYTTFSTQKATRYALVNHGFEFSETYLDSSDIPENTSVLMVADPITPFTQKAIDRIKKYVDAGGNLIVLGEPGRQNILNPLLQHVGVQFTNGKIIHGNTKYSPDFVAPLVAAEAPHLMPLTNSLLLHNLILTAPTAMGISNTDSSDNFHFTSLLQTDTGSWMRTGTINMDSGFVAFNPSAGDKKQSHVIAAALTRQLGDHQQRIIVMGDADCLSTREILRENFLTSNADLATAFFGWLSDDKLPVNTTHPPPTDNKLRITRTEVPLLKSIYQAGLPLSFLFFGMYVLLVRKRK